MSETARETPVSEFLFGMSLIVRVRVETHRSSREQRRSLMQGAYGQVRPKPVI